jgi:hypothetical protein
VLRAVHEQNKNIFWHVWELCFVHDQDGLFAMQVLPLRDADLPRCRGATEPKQNRELALQALPEKGDVHILTFTDRQ